MSTRRPLAAAAAVLTLTLAACGGSDASDEGDEGIASLGTDAASDGTAETGDDSTDDDSTSTDDRDDDVEAPSEVNVLVHSTQMRLRSISDEKTLV
ncbi:MAG: hypothetical protein AAGF91_09460 [Actinomycetota bacterium]